MFLSVVCIQAQVPLKIANDYSAPGTKQSQFPMHCALKCADHPSELRGSPERHACSAWLNGSNTWHSFAELFGNGLL